MDNISCMQVESSREQLVHKVLKMFISQFLSRINDTMHICFHKFGHNVDVFIASGCRRFQHIDQVDDVLLIEELQKFDFTNNTFGINEILESLWHFLDGDF